ncbi:MarR family winged helix-turn-helix transcriptional regulator [Aliarcobacter vitoriensis]|uniref:HTH-type transcriptional regulator SarZ n=1 Tax=Aliarcobacter vitoriensis TaxID=2011099 RepID=A0A366MVD7_9BACT|nr:MarR family transcriptional regulator [Aliarcobacter vitoriensis]RBQ29570.1 MarR family transcriptional regulator [Aliarcobacter vitoriensis]
MEKKEFDFSKMVCFLLNSTSNAMIRDYRPHLEEFNLTYPQYLVMMTLWNNDNILIKDISKETFFDSATLTPILKRLEEKSYIIRTQSLSDERGKIIKLTKEGKNLKYKTAHIFKNMECKIQLSNEEQEDIIKICNKILSKLNN